MKVIFSALLIICVMFISSCSVLSKQHMGCGNPTGCWKKYYRETPCGTYVTSPCGALCKSCTFNDPACKACWICLNNDGCAPCEATNPDSCRGNLCPSSCIGCEVNN